MSLATIYTRSSSGINAPLVTVEAHLANGLPSLNIVGLPEALKKVRTVSAALLLTVNLSSPQNALPST
jgi:predicted ATPase with chaperone activity